MSPLWFSVSSVSNENVCGLADFDQRFERGHAFFADAFDFVQIVHAFEAAVFGAVGQNPLGHFGADAGQNFQLRLRRLVQINGIGGQIFD